MIGPLLLVAAALSSQSSPLLGDVARERGESFLGASLYLEAPLPALDTLLVSPATRTFGAARVRWLEPFERSRGTFELDFNTDTLFVGWHQPEMFGRNTHLSTYLVAQAFGARVLSSHVRAGVLEPRRAFHASYALAGITGSVLFARPAGAWLWLDTTVGARQWLFSPIPKIDLPFFAQEGTSSRLLLPSPMQVIEVGTGIRLDAWRRVTRLAWREGVWASAWLETHFRTGASTWGDLGSSYDERNDFRVPFPTMAKASLGARVVGEPRLASLRPVAEVSASAGAGFGLDDVNRFLIGGESPWVVPLAGAAWAEFYADRYASLQLATGLVVKESLGLRAGLEVASVNDPLRQGDLARSGPLAGAFADMEWAVTERLAAHLRFGQGLLLPRVPGDRRMKIAAGVSLQL